MSKQVLVDAEALKQVLQAFLGSPHLIRELQYTLQPEALFPDNPVNVLLRDWVVAKGVAE